MAARHHVGAPDVEHGGARAEIDRLDGDANVAGQVDERLSRLPLRRLPFGTRKMHGSSRSNARTWLASQFLFPEENVVRISWMTTPERGALVPVRVDSKLDVIGHPHRDSAGHSMTRRTGVERRLPRLKLAVIVRD